MVDERSVSSMEDIVEDNGLASLSDGKGPYRWLIRARRLVLRIELMLRLFVC